ncbi:AAA family ATPase [Clostridium perfringens]|nr:AAA family ATPase [Clostridium perfringens]
MNYINILDLQPNKVSTNIKDYSFMLTAPSGFGKTPFLYELFGKEAFFLSFDNSHKGVAGIMAVNIDSYDTLKFYVSQLKNPMVRAKYDVVVIDTLSMFDLLCEKSVTDSYGKETISDCLNYNKGYTIVDKRFLEIIKSIQMMDYSIVYVCHPTQKKVKLPNGQEIIKMEPKVSNRVQTLIMPEIDIRLYADYDNEGNKVIFTQSSPFFDARCRVGEMDAVVPFNTKALREAFAVGIDRKYEKDSLTDGLEHRNVAINKERDFEEIMTELISLGQELETAGMGSKAQTILDKQLGCDNDGKQRTLADVNESMKPALEVVIVELKSLKESIA